MATVEHVDGPTFSDRGGGMTCNDRWLTWLFLFWTRPAYDPYDLSIRGSRLAWVGGIGEF